MSRQHLVRLFSWVALAVVAALPACKTTSQPPEVDRPGKVAHAGNVEHVGSGDTARTSEKSAAQSAELREAPQGPSAVGRAGGYALAVPKNVLWLPWKMVGGALKGASDGVQAGFERDRQPLLGVVFSPVNLVAGFATGLVGGTTMGPFLVGPDDNYGRVMSSPISNYTDIWWYP